MHHPLAIIHYDKIIQSGNSYYAASGIENINNNINEQWKVRACQIH